ncbi:BCCT family transporter [Nocardiopsis composta]
MATTLFHWTLHPWAIYAVVGLAIAYGTYRRGRRQLISAAFIPLIGEKAANGPVGKLIDVLAIFATLFGSATSLGLGALQIAGGFQELGWVTTLSSGLLVGIIVALMIAFVVSAVSGVERGIQWLSNINMGMAALILLFLLVVGPTVYILDMIPTSLGAYLQDFFTMSGRTEASGGEDVGGWLTSWTIFYWAWWISWTPFVGMFIGKISRGRTIRQFVSGVILVPSVVSLVWFAILGGTAINLQSGGVDIYGDGSQEGMLYGLLAQFPWATVISVIVAVLVAIFFITGADSASIVMGTLSQRGANVPHRGITVFWGVLMAAVAAITLVASGGESTGLDGLQRMTILVAAPWTVVMLLMCVSLIKDLQRDPKVIRSHKARRWSPPPWSPVPASTTATSSWSPPRPRSARPRRTTRGRTRTTGRPPRAPAPDPTGRTDPGPAGRPVPDRTDAAALAGAAASGVTGSPSLPERCPPRGGHREAAAPGRARRWRRCRAASPGRRSSRPLRLQPLGQVPAVEGGEQQGEAGQDVVAVGVGEPAEQVGDEHAGRLRLGPPPLRPRRVGQHQPQPVGGHVQLPGVLRVALVPPAEGRRGVAVDLVGEPFQVPQLGAELLLFERVAGAHRSRLLTSSMSASSAPTRTSTPPILMSGSSTIPSARSRRASSASARPWSATE